MSKAVMYELVKRLVLAWHNLDIALGKATITDPTLPSALERGRAETEMRAAVAALAAATTTATTH